MSGNEHKGAESIDSGIRDKFQRSSRYTQHLAQGWTLCRHSINVIVKYLVSGTQSLDIGDTTDFILLGHDPGKMMIIKKMMMIIILIA